MHLNSETIAIAVVVLIGGIPFAVMMFNRLRLKDVDEAAFVNHPKLRQAGMSEDDIRRVRQEIEAALEAEQQLHPDMTMGELSSLEFLGDWIDDVTEDLNDEEFKSLENVETLAEFMIVLWNAERRHGATNNADGPLL